MKRHTKKETSFVGKLVFLIILFVLAGVLVIKTNKINNPLTQKKTASPSSSKMLPTPTLRNIAREGRQEYSITQKGQGSVEFYKAVVDPEKVQPGMAQSMSVWVKDSTSPIKKVTAHIETDNGIVKEPMYLREGTATDGKWVGNWKVKNTTSRTYATAFKAVNENGNTGEARIGWTDPGLPCGTGTINCTVTAGNWTLYYAAGADGGTLTWTSGATTTLASGVALVIGSTFNFTNGTIIANNPSYLLSGYLCGQDADADGYCGVDIYAATQANCSDVSPRTKRLGGAASGQASYCAGDGTLTQNNYGYDCYDANANAKPNQTAYYGTNRGDGSFDYNCNGVESHGYSGGASCGGTTSCSGSDGWYSGDPGCGNTAYWQTNCVMGYDSCAPSVLQRQQVCL